ncbi:MAG: hypothetical protein BGO80_09690 [Devosia sp. 63-57]|nr:MAG: hypothetical protein ABS74_08300 [Pelagibacterium sp. SCN 63-126]OJX41840.1 MAG: hypothetical protein BGO80_09690 [Devosia sp. 63-57]
MLTISTKTRFITITTAEFWLASCSITPCRNVAEWVYAWLRCLVLLLPPLQTGTDLRTTRWPRMSM